jgi:integrase
MCNALNRTIGDWLQLPITQITKQMVLERFVSLSDANGPRGTGAAQANLVMRYLRALYNFAIALYENEDGEQIIKVNPVAQLSKLKAWNKVKRRTTIVKRLDLPAWFKAVQTLPESPESLKLCSSYPDRGAVARDYLTLLWLTGCRRSEAVNLQWKDVDLKCGFITFHDTKNGKSHTLPLSRYLWQMLSERRMAVESSHPYVFPGTLKNKPISKWSKRINSEVIRLTGIKFTLHDLRRGFASTAAQLGLEGPTLKRLLNHSTDSDVTAGYVCMEPEDLREHMQAITDRLLGYADYLPPDTPDEDVIVSFMRKRQQLRSGSRPRPTRISS